MERKTKPPHAHLTGEKHPATKWTLDVMAGAVLAIDEVEEHKIAPGDLNLNHWNLYHRITLSCGYDAVIAAAGFDPQETRKRKQGNINEVV